MSSQDRVERVLKDIHVTFSKCEQYGNNPNKIIVDRKKFLELIDRLNMGIYDMLEEYEHTQQSRDKAEREFRKKGDQIVRDANAQAEDVYAASMLYTADMIGRIRELMDRTNDSMNDLFREFRRDMRGQKDLLKKHETELEGQLSDLSDSRKYLSLLDDINHERKRREREASAEAERPERHSRTSVYTPPAAADVKVNEQYFEKSGKAAPGAEGSVSAPAAEKPDIIVNKDAAYFKWKESRKADGGPEEKKPEDPGAFRSAKAEDMPAPEEAAEVSENGNAEFPNEDAILQAVLADELAKEQEETEAGEEGEDGGGARGGSLLKRLIFGK